MTSLLRARPASTPDMLEAFGDEALLRGALAFEAALARAQAAEGLVSPAAADLIAEVCAEAQFDVAALAAASAHTGTLAIPLVVELRRQVALRDAGAASLVHLGATSQDVADTALMLQAKAGMALLSRDAEQLIQALSALTRAHAATPMLGRTLLQGALPISFGLKAANWMAGVQAAYRRLLQEAQGALALQFGGAAGTRGNLSGRGDAVARRMADGLALACPALPWQARRDGTAGLGTSLAILTGSLGKIARDISLLAQGEVAEAREPRLAGRGGSSAMAHKRNPTGSQVVLSAALRTPGLAATLMSVLPQEHERGLGGWQAEGPVLAELFELTHGALAALLAVVEGLEVDSAAMARNLDAATVGHDLGESEALVAAALVAYVRT